MAAGYLPEPGTEHGPCLDETCEHASCKDTRTMRATRCKLCHETIGSRPFYNIPPETGPTWNGDLRHATCEVERIERERETGDGK